MEESPRSSSSQLPLSSYLEAEEHVPLMRRLLHPRQHPLRLLLHHLNLSRSSTGSVGARRYQWQPSSIPNAEPTRHNSEASPASQRIGPSALLNPDSGQSVCVTGAEATASDGQNPSVSYAWTASGGSFNSTTSQWVEWTALPGVASFTLTVEASATGYTSDTDSLNVQVVPEFSSLAPPFLLAILLAVLLTRKRSRHDFV